MVLIVSEREKTEPNYFPEMINDLKLNTVNIKVIENSGRSAPISIVNSALNEYKKEKEYDHVYCVFDKDQHESYDQDYAKGSLDVYKITKDKIQSAKVAVRMRISPVSQNFEFS